VTLVMALAGVCAAQGPSRITLDRAVELALQHSPALKAVRTQVPQSQAQEITANLRPNPALGWDSQFVPIFQPSQFSKEELNTIQQFDVGLGYLFERGQKRQHRLLAAQDQTAITRAQVADAERTLAFNVGQQFIAALLAESNLQFAQEALKSFQQTVEISEAQYQAGAISEGDLLKIKLQMLQFQTDVNNAQLARVQALAGLRQLIGYEAVPADYDVTGELTFTPVKGSEDDFKALALRQRPDLLAAQRGVNAAQSQYTLARANGKWDLNFTFNYTHVAGLNTGTFFFNLPLPLFNRNQGEIARTQFAITQAQDTQTAATETVLNDVTNAYEALRSSDQVVQLYLTGYRLQAKQSVDISHYAYTRGAASLLDYLDAERSYRQSELAYRQALATYMTAVEQLRQAVGTRNLP
jgi:cobalt-zinc-cadmium efflux system outer membrane protein